MKKKSSLKKYFPSDIEKKWQSKWESAGVYKTDLTSQTEKKYYVLAEFPYPSGDLHMGHWFTFSGADVYARFKRMQGYQVFFPNGFDAFGLPAENAAIKRGIHPQNWTLSNIEKMKQQFATMGASFSFDNEVITCLPIYYQWNQWIFLKLYEKGLAYKGTYLSNWCTTCQTVLANEGVVEGLCWRCGTVVIQKEVDQWFFKITEYAQKLLWEQSPKDGEREIDWPKSVRDAQNSWIGKSEGMHIHFPLEEKKKEIIVYTVFPETIYGVTYMVLAPEHQLVQELTTPEKKEEVEKYVKLSQSRSERERSAEEREKTGVFTGSYCINPVNGKKVPIWISDYVIGSYATGAVMGVPGSDERDFAFAQKYNLEIIRVIGKTKDEQSPVAKEEDVCEEGYLVNSDRFSGLATPQEAKEAIKKYLEEKGYGKRKTNYHLHDWSISRQRYWGTPIPMVYCDDCGMVPVPLSDLPVELPYEVDYTPKGKAPLASNEKWLLVKCPQCKKQARRDAETMDTFVDSSWYFFRFLDPSNKDEIFDQKVASRMMPVDIYFGGAEHTLGHTLYSRFFTKFFHELGITSIGEYAAKRVNHGVILGPDGNRMSKSKGNVVNPDEEVKRYGADTIRVHLAFFMPYEGTSPWVSERVWGAHRFLQRVWALSEKVVDAQLSEQDLYMMHKTIKKVTDDLQVVAYNTAVAILMEWLNYLSAKESVTNKEYETLLLLLAPFAPHMTEELWQVHHNTTEIDSNASWSIHQTSWPEYEASYLTLKTQTIVVQVNGKVRDNIVVDEKDVSDQKNVEDLAMKSEKVTAHIEGKNILKTIYIKGKIINFVTG